MKKQIKESQPPGSHFFEGPALKSIQENPQNPSKRKQVATKPSSQLYSLDKRIEQNLAILKGTHSSKIAPHLQKVYYPFPVAIAPKFPGKLRYFMFTLIGSLAIAAILLLFYTTEPSNIDSQRQSAVVLPSSPKNIQSVKFINPLLVRAELLYGKFHYKEALQLYDKFLDEFPDDPAVLLVYNKIQDIQNVLLRIKQERIQDLKRNLTSLRRKEAAKRSTARFSEISTEALSDISIALIEESTYMTAKFLLYYEEQAQAAMKAGQYNRAIQYYKRILQLDIYDKNARDQLALAIKKMRVTEDDSASDLNTSSIINKEVVQYAWERMQYAKKSAINLKAQQSKDFTMAIKKERDAGRAFNENNYSVAFPLIEQASWLFKEAQNTRLSQFRTRLKLARQEALKVKRNAKKRKAHFHANELFQQAKKEEELAEVASFQKQYIKAITHYQQAKTLYQSAVKKVN